MKQGLIGVANGDAPDVRVFQIDRWKTTAKAKSDDGDIDFFHGGNLACLYIERSGGGGELIRRKFHV